MMHIAPLAPAGAGMCMTVHPPKGGPLSALLGLHPKHFGTRSGIVFRHEKGCRVVYQMGSHYSLWVTDPYDLEIGSLKATRFSCPRSKAE